MSGNAEFARGLQFDDKITSLWPPKRQIARVFPVEYSCGGAFKADISPHVMTIVQVMSPLGCEKSCQTRVTLLCARLYAISASNSCTGWPHALSQLCPLSQHSPGARLLWAVTLGAQRTRERDSD